MCVCYGLLHQSVPFLVGWKTILTEQSILQLSFFILEVYVSLGLLVTKVNIKLSQYKISTSQTNTGYFIWDQSLLIVKET